MTKIEIDFIVNEKPNIFKDEEVSNKVNFASDHRTLLGKIKIKISLYDKRSWEQNQGIPMWRKWEKVQRNFNFN